MVGCAIAAVAAALALRASGPSDLWDQTQPKTVSATTDIVANGRIVLPIERGRFPATKPPLYNWLAAPAVAALGFASEFAHRLPSALALVSLAALVYVAGRSVETPNARGVGALAVLMLVSCYTIFKLGWLARPDMLLTLWLALGWWAASQVIVRSRSRRRGARAPVAALVVLFWTCVSLALLTKGPPAIILPVYALVAPSLLRRPSGASGLRRPSGARGGLALKSSALRMFHFAIGLPLAIAPLAMWIVAVGLIDPDHLRTLIGEEILGRVTGLGSEGSREGAWSLLIDLPLMPVYFAVRFAPWSILTAAGVVALVRTKYRRRTWRRLGRRGAILAGAAFFLVLTLALYSLSAGKRADYLAAAMPLGAIIGAWWVAQPLRWVLAALTPVGAAVALGLLGAHDHRAPEAPCPGFGDAIVEFARGASRVMAAEPHPVAFLNAGSSPLQALLGASEPDDPETFERLAGEGRPFWLVAGHSRLAPGELDRRASRWYRGARLSARLESERLPVAAGWPGTVTLYLVRVGEAEGEVEGRELVNTGLFQGPPLAVPIRAERRPARFAEFER